MMSEMSGSNHYQKYHVNGKGVGSAGLPSYASDSLHGNSVRKPSSLRDANQRRNLSDMQPSEMSALDRNRSE